MNIINFNKNFIKKNHLILSLLLSFVSINVTSQIDFCPGINLNRESEDFVLTTTHNVSSESCTNFSFKFSILSNRTDRYVAGSGKYYKIDLYDRKFPNSLRASNTIESSNYYYKSNWQHNSSFDDYGYSIEFDLSNLPIEDIKNLKAKITHVKTRNCVYYIDDFYTLLYNTPSLHTDDYRFDLCSSFSDQDSDGIPDSSDNCPNNPNPDQADTDGDGIGDVCDTTNGKPDLTSDKSNISIISECSSCPIALSLLGIKKHIISRNGGILSFQQIVVENDGTVASSNAKINYYLSVDGALSVGDYKFPTSTNIPVIQSGSYTVFSHSIFGSDFDNLQPYGNYTLIMKIDGDNQVSESNENNNIFKIPITFRQSINKPGGPFKPIDDLKRTFDDTLDKKFYNLYIYNFYGRLIDKVVIKNENDERESIRCLPNGLYILNSINGSRKVYVKK